MLDQRPSIILSNAVAGWCVARTYVDNAAHAIALIATNPNASGRVYHVADPNPIPEYELLQSIGGKAGWKGQIAVVPSDSLPDGFQCDPNWQDIVLDSRRIRAELGYREIVGRDEALRRTVDWQRENPPEQYCGVIDYQMEDDLLRRNNLEFFTCS